MYFFFTLFFRFKNLRPDPDDCPEAFKVLHSMCKMWTNFAKYGNPTPDSDTALNLKWTPVKKIQPGDAFELNYLEIGEGAIEMKCNPDQERIQFWRDVYGKWNSGFLKAKL